MASYICNNSGYILWFADTSKHKVLFKDQEDNQEAVIDYETSVAMPDECPMCFGKKDEAKTVCKNCGYKFK